nr:MAG TPA: hypothetical protein [Caudoviricetes sp.]
MNSIEIAQKELEAAGFFDADSDYEGALGDAVMTLIKTFNEQHHSGFSAMIVINLFDRLAKHKPLTPLTGEDWEWEKMSLGTDEDGDNQAYINIRCPFIIKDSDGMAYNTEGKIFSDDGVVWYTNKNSRIPITFPYSVPNEPVRVILGEDNAD